MLADFAANAKEAHLYDGFNFDTTNVATQIAAVGAAVDTYYAPLINGLVTDVDASIEALRSALQSAGMQDVLDELDAQTKAYVEERQGKQEVFKKVLNKKEIVRKEKRFLFSVQV